MDLFYLIVGSIAVVLLIVMLTYAGILMTYNKKTTSSDPFPPSKSTCPDYWTASQDLSYCMIPGKTSRNIGTIFDSKTGVTNLTVTSTPGYNQGSGSDRINFNDTDWSKSGTSTCNQKTWAKTYGVFWDGVTNYNGCK